MRCVTQTTSPLIARVAAAAARRWRASLAVWIVLIGFGLWAYSSALQREGFPPIETPVAIVTGLHFADDTGEVDRDVVGPLHDAYSVLEGVKSIQTIAQEDSYVLVVEFESGISSADGAAILRARTPGLGFPPAPVVRSVDATKFVDSYDALIAVTGPPGASAEELQLEAGSIASQLLARPEIATAKVRALLAEAPDEDTGIDEVRTRQFARVAYGGDEEFSDAITVGVTRHPQLDQDLLEFSDALHDVLGQLEVSAGFELEVTADFANNIRTQLAGLLRNLLTGLIAVAAVSLILIGWRASIVTAVFMATVMLTAVVGLWAFGYTLNTITLFGLILTLGLLVDDAIVVSEAVDAGSEPGVDDDDNDGEGAVSAIQQAITRVGPASFAGTITTVLVFAPMLFVGGLLGDFIQAIPATVIIALVASFVLSMTLIPALGRRLLVARPASRNPVVAGQRFLARRLGALAAYPSRNGVKGWLVGGAPLGRAPLVVYSASIGGASVPRDIFPDAKDTNSLLISVDFDADVEVEEAAVLTEPIDDAVLRVLGEDLLQAQYIRGSEREATLYIDLVPFDERDTTAPTYVDLLSDAIPEIQRARVSVKSVGAGPPDEDYPFAVQISMDDDSVATGQALAEEMRSTILGATVEKPGGETATIVDAIISTEGQILRTNTVRQIEVRGVFDTDDTTSNVDAAERLVTELYPPEALVARGLAPDALTFDFGLESENRASVGSLLLAMVIALVLMLALLMIQFRSFVQPLLVFVAIPFSFFGVMAVLAASDNALSFFVMVGFIALIGVVVNNTILVVDAANQERRAGATAKDAIRVAIERRFRPLIATTATTVAGLLPLAMSDPFWEGLSLTLIGGLVSSTVLVLFAFPVCYLAVEAVRTPVRNMVRRRRGRELIA